MHERYNGTRTGTAARGTCPCKTHRKASTAYDSRVRGASSPAALVCTWHHLLQGALNPDTNLQVVPIPVHLMFNMSCWHACRLARMTPCAARTPLPHLQGMPTCTTEPTAHPSHTFRACSHAQQSAPHTPPTPLGHAHMHNRAHRTPLPHLGHAHMHNRARCTYLPHL